MKTFGLILSFLFFFNITIAENPVIVPSNSLDDITSQITLCIQNANAECLSQYFYTNVQLTFPDKGGTFSKAQSQQILRDFFTKNPPKSYVLKKEGGTDANTKFCIGEYTSTNGKTYITYILIKKFGNQFYLHQLQFEDK